jgi:hypothetical protein
MTYTPNDPALMRAIDQEIEHSVNDERVVFIDTENKVREAVYASEFKTGLIPVRERLEKSGVLKAVVHVSATVLGSRTGHGARFTTVEYLPTGRYFVRQRIVPKSRWVSAQDLVDTAVDVTRALFEDDGEEEETEEGK